MIVPARDRVVLPRSFAIGVAAGMRSQLPLAMMALEARRGRFASTSGPPLSLLNTPSVAGAATIAAMGELVADKLPIVPSRLQPGPLIGRLAIGAVAGAAVAREANSPIAQGLAAGMAGAVLGAFGGYTARRQIVAASRLPDQAVALVEDFAAASIGFIALRSAAHERRILATG